MLAVAFAASIPGCAFRFPCCGKPTVAFDATTAAVVKQQGLTIRLVKNTEDTNRFAFEVEGLSADALRLRQNSPPDQTGWSKIFSASVAPPGATGRSDLPEIQGSYLVSGDRLRFEPQFPLQPGMQYRVEVHPGNLAGTSPEESKSAIGWFRLPAPVRIPKTFVEHVYPSSSVLPENLLKFYIHFSGPMSQGDIYKHIHLLNSSGKSVVLPFLEIDEELWNPELTRLTLFIDPGRLKRGVQPLEELGPAMEAGKSYTLVIDRDWQDGDGAPLKAAFRKRFAVVLPDRQPPLLANWKITPPKQDTRESLIIQFSEPMEHALAERLIWILDDHERALAGRVMLINEERHWSFTPEIKWKGGSYKIAVNPLLEDLAGNSVGKPFEVDVFDSIQPTASEKPVTLLFEVR